MEGGRSKYFSIGNFQIGSNGLASGNDLLEAILSGLYEVIERDAVSCHRMRESRNGRRLPRVILDTIPWSSVRELLDRLTFAGVRTILYDCTMIPKSRDVCC